MKRNFKKLDMVKKTVMELSKQQTGLLLGGNATLFVILLVATGFGGCKQSDNQNNDFVLVDVTASYSKKELILQDFMDIEYIVLETNDEFVTQGEVLDIGKEHIVVINDIRDGEILLFDRTGKGLRTINRMGQGSEEYLFIDGITLDEENGELFVNVGYEKQFMVYDLFGKFKRKLPYNEDITYYDAVRNYDKESLICSDLTNPEFFSKKMVMHSLISKQDGSIIRDIPIPFREKKTIALLMHIDGAAMGYSENTIHFTGTDSHPIIPYQGNWILTEPSADTIFLFSSDDSLTPFIVRIPSIHSMNPEIFLFPDILTDRYFFMRSVKKTMRSTNVAELSGSELNRGYPTTYLMYDRQLRTIFESSVFNGDYSTKKRVDMSQTTVNNEVAFWKKIESYQLVESYNKGELRGKLKEIAAGLDEESNPVIMLAKYKKQ